MTNIKILQKSIFLLIVLICSQFFAQTKKPQNPQDWETAKLFYFHYLLNVHPKFVSAISSESDLKNIFNQRNQRFINADKCENVACITDAFKWNESEISAVQQAYAKLYDKDPSFKIWFEKEVLKSGKYSNSNSNSAKEKLAKIIAQDLHGMNTVIDIYGNGKKPNYPEIDSISFNTKDKNYLGFLKNVQQDVAYDVQNNDKEYFASTLLSALRLLEVNERWDAAQLEPLIATENKAAFEKIKKTDFSKYPYSAVLVLGAGPQIYGQKISPLGMLRSRQGLRVSQKYNVPFIIVSGGRVHPYKTQYIEALEMKHYLMEVLMVPESSIIIDPYARHTTTNVRNASRILLEYGFPKDKFALVTSSKTHIDYVEKDMAKRSLQELGNVPYLIGKRLDELALEFKPTEEAKIINPNEPLDP